MKKTNELIMEMIAYYKGDPMRIQHFLKVYEFAKIIGEEEKLDDRTQFILETAAVVHDIGIKVAQEKYGKCHGKLQEQEGPAVAEDMLKKLGYESDVIARVSYLVGHHHTYKNVDGLDYQILLEADFLVNIYEDELDEAAARAAVTNVFQTNTGIGICNKMFDL